MSESKKSPRKATAALTFNRGKNEKQTLPQVRNKWKKLWLEVEPLLLLLPYIPLPSHIFFLLEENA